MIFYALDSFHIYYLEFFREDWCFITFICFFNNLFIIIWTYGYWFYSLPCNTMLIYFFAQFVPAWVIEGSFRLVSLSFRNAPASILLFGWMETSLLFGSSCICPLLHFCLRHFSKFPCYFFQRMAFRNQDLDTRGAHWSWGLTAYRPSQQTELRDICMYKNPCIHSYLYVFM